MNGDFSPVIEPPQPRVQLRDFRELREEDLVAMGMPLLQRRRFLMSAAVAVLP